jgi:hypothetical protein
MGHGADEVSWYYTREAGPEGQVLTDEGTPAGTVLTTLLQSGPLPIGIGLEVVAFLADIITIAEEDNVMHGDINPGDVFIDVSGAVSLSGYGVSRPSGRAPEGRPIFLSSDVYGLGIVLHAILSREPMGAIPRDRDGHDDAIVDRLLAIDWSDLQSIAGRDPVVHFLCSMLAFDVSERPAPLDVANILSEVSRQLKGVSIEDWSAIAMGTASPTPAPPSVEEVLEGAQELGRVFNKTGQYSRRRTASAKGECTAFWSREKISAMLDDGEDQLAGSQMFQRRDLEQRLSEDSADFIAPQAVIRSPQPQRPAPGEAYPDEVPWSPDSTMTGNPNDAELKTALAGLRSQAASSLPDSPPAVSVASIPGSPVVAAHPRTPVSPPPSRAPAGKSFPWLAVVLVAVGMGMIFTLLGVAGVIYYYMDKQEAAPAAPAELVQEPPSVEPEAEPIPEVKVKKPRRTRRAARPARAAPPTPRPSTPPAPVAPMGTYQVTFRSMGAEAQFVCGDGQSGRFVGVTRRQFSDVTTCRITIDDADGAVQVRRASIVNCSKAGTAVACTGT